MQQVQDFAVGQSDQSLGQNFTTSSPIVVGSNYARTPNELQATVASQMLPSGGLQQQVYSQPASMPIMSNPNSSGTLNATHGDKPTAFEAFTAPIPEQVRNPTPVASSHHSQQQSAQSSKLSSEFVPDPNFNLFQINQNIRENKVINRSEH